MRRIKVRTDGEIIEAIKIASIAGSLLLVVVPQLIYIMFSKYSNLNYWTHFKYSFIGITVLIGCLGSVYLFSRYSPIPELKIRKKLILFTLMFLNSKDDGLFRHSVEWCYEINQDIINIKLRSNGLVNDKAKLGSELSEYIDETLLHFEEQGNMACYTFGKHPERLEGYEVMNR